jgi:CBS domain-containing protein
MVQIRDIMTDRIAYIGPDASVAQAAQLMQKHNVGSIPVVDQESVVGIVTDRDIVVRGVAHGKDAASTPVSQVMTSEIHSASPDMSLQEAAQIMSEYQVRRLPVVDQNRLVGIVSLGDLATFGKYDVEVSHTLGKVSSPSEPENI